MTGPRIPPVTEPDDEQRELLEGAMRAGNEPLNIFRTLVHSPKLYKRFAQFGGHLLLRGALPAREREIVILRVGWRSRSVYEFGQHTVIGAASGLTDEEIVRLASEGVEGWSADDAALVALADDLCATDTVSDATWAALAGRWNEAELVELLLVAGFYRLVSGFLNAAGVELDPGVPGWPAV